MYLIYDLVVHTARIFLNLASFFDAKLRLFVNGRKGTFAILEANVSKSDQVIWIHTASLGEFEQGLPIMEAIRSRYPSYKILVTFFSPSGYEVKKRTPVADLVTYLPLDSAKNAKRFLKLTHPKLAIFVKYEIWPNYLRTLNNGQIPTLLISALFKNKQIYFKWYGNFMRKSLGGFSHFFVQDKNSEVLLNSIGHTNVSVSGDTRFDRVSQILERDNTLGFMSSFKGNQDCFVAGSTWPEDESVLVPYINSSNKNIKYVLAPHNIKEKHIDNLVSSLNKKAILYSQIGDLDISNYEVLIVDTIGLLTKIYSYADIAYVGGGFATGLHNTLEPAVFGIPVVIGPHYQDFKEAQDLVSLQGILPILNANSLKDTLNRLLDHPEYARNTGDICKRYIARKKGATNEVVSHIDNWLI
ncbi:3-deoxy-D-manno-octulosonic acid transferase [Flavobacteriaceae bacterium F89]|uniref:3-deoxy-D-manno-octulosonic acid transferase n=1 Tax=Cerina litoralis TaxID=2874477 RepID=A0AAE3EWR6_9FLAO|nr:glycosyltransferase N-terminal domain-containing protein [Cerina litoralis]MCG2461544.1 3-deoxy-D-manno-octulosonic acid transferase [Cerina litoralis]